MITGMMLESRIPAISTFHKITGYLMAVVVIVHLFMNGKWIVSMTKRLFSTRRKMAVLLAGIVVPIAMCLVLFAFFLAPRLRADEHTYRNGGQIEQSFNRGRHGNYF
jgi:peptidoglycan biosynthesis protein MviN/MurJ (putative lipid II flippase)